jgi:hypothetical protein
MLMVTFHSKFLFVQGAYFPLCIWLLWLLSLLLPPSTHRICPFPVFPSHKALVYIVNIAEGLGTFFWRG